MALFEKDILLRRATVVLHYALPLGLLVGFLTACFISICVTRRTLDAKSSPKVQHRHHFWLLILVILTYVAEACVAFVEDIRLPQTNLPPDEKDYILLSLTFWGVQLLSYLGFDLARDYPFYITWAAAIGVEPLAAFLRHIDRPATNSFGYSLLALQAFRFCIVISLLGFPLVICRRRRTKGGAEDEESQRLLPPEQQEQEQEHEQVQEPARQRRQSSKAKSYGATDRLQNDAKTGGDSSSGDNGTGGTDQSNGGDSSTPKPPDKASWWVYSKRLKVIIPFFKIPRRLWPNAAFSMVCLLAGRVLALLVPRQLGRITDALGPGKGVPWTRIGLYVLYTLLQSSAGVGAVKALCWPPIERNIYRTASTGIFQHIMTLSSDFHENKQSGEILEAMNIGGSLLNIFRFGIFYWAATWADAFVAIAYLYNIFGVYMGFIVSCMIAVYFTIRMSLNPLQDEKRKDYYTKIRTESSIRLAAIMNWSTVFLFNRSKDETERYMAAKSRTHADKAYIIFSRATRAFDSLVMTAGLGAACSLAAYQVGNGGKSLGTFVILLTYWSSLEGSIDFLAYGVRGLMDDMLNLERAVEILETKPTVADKEEATELQVTSGSISFENVCAAYDPRQQTLKNVSFVAKPGEKMALVGESGAGKSTIFKLLLRLYDVTAGSIKIDGQDIRDTTMASLRARIGVVPQTPVLFNETIMYNVRYARLDATDEEVFNACKAAAIHDKILSFPEGYNSKVGEQGVKLSGGELQRVSIARAMLKDAQIVLLDEATSMVDSIIESQIQTELDRLTKGRTTLVIAHRLSTIINADVILVLKEGEIVERGSHKELLSKKGAYYTLWSKQTGAAPSSIGNGGLTSTEVPVFLNDIPAADLANLVMGESAEPESRRESATESPKATEQDKQLDNKPAPECSPRMLKPREAHERSKSLGENKAVAGFWKPDVAPFVPQEQRRGGVRVRHSVPGQMAAYGQGSQSHPRPAKGEHASTAGIAESGHQKPVALASRASDESKIQPSQCDDTEANASSGMSASKDGGIRNRDADDTIARPQTAGNTNGQTETAVGGDAPGSDTPEKFEAGQGMRNSSDATEANAAATPDAEAVDENSAKTADVQPADSPHHDGREGYVEGTAEAADVRPTASLDKADGGNGIERRQERSAIENPVPTAGDSFPEEEASGNNAQSAESDDTKQKFLEPGDSMKQQDLEPGEHDATSSSNMGTEHAKEAQPQTASARPPTIPDHEDTGHAEEEFTRAGSSPGSQQAMEPQSEGNLPQNADATEIVPPGHDVATLKGGATTASADVHRAATISGAVNRRNHPQETASSADTRDPRSGLKQAKSQRYHNRLWSKTPKSAQKQASHSPDHHHHNQQHHQQHSRQGHLADASRASATPAEVSEVSTHSAPAQHYANALAPLLASTPKHDETPRKLWKSKSKRVRFGQHGRTQSETGGAAAERSAEGSSASEPVHSSSPPPPPSPERASGTAEESRHAAGPALTKPATGRRGSNTSTHSQGQNQNQGQGQSQGGRRPLKWKSRKHHKKRSNSDDAAAGAAASAAGAAGGSSHSLAGASRE